MNLSTFGFATESWLHRLVELDPPSGKLRICGNGPIIALFAMHDRLITEL